MSLATAFSGIEMFALGLGEPPEWQAETEQFPAEISRLRYPDTEQLGDVRLVDDGAPRVTEFAFGFPCQDLSRAGRNAGLLGDRSALWFEGERLVAILQPDRVYIENVPDLLRKGMCAVVEGLVNLGYSVEWDCLPAAVVGAPHLRDRVWIVAHRKKVPYVFGPAASLFPHPVSEPGSNGWLKWPRAGFTRRAGYVQELQPMAPLAKVKRGALLRGALSAGGLLPTVVASDSKGSRRATAKTEAWTSNDGTTLLDAVRQGVAARLPDGDFLPTPVADDVKGDVVGHLRNKNGWDSAKRTRITSLAVLARNSFEQPTEEQLEEAHRTAGETDRARASGWEGDKFPTPMAADGDRSSEQGVRFYKEGTDNPTLLGAARRFPTPTVQDAHNDGGPSQHERNSLPLNTHVKVWPTPRASGGESSAGGGEGATYRRTPSQQDGSHGLYLQSEVFEAEIEAGRVDPDTLLPVDPGERWPTPHGMPKDGQSRNPGPSGNELGRAVNESLLPTPRASDGDKRNRGDLVAHAKERPNSHHHGDREPGRSDERRAGSLNPDWVEWLMGCPIGWTNPNVPNEDLVLHPWNAEPAGVPRVVENASDRVARLSALGNALVPQIPAFIADRARR